MKRLRLAACLLVALLSSCNQDDITLQQGSGNDDATMITNGTLTEKITVASTCTNGFTISGGYSNIGGNGGVDLTASAITLSGPGTAQTLTSGKLYRLSKNTTSLSNTNSFSVSNSGSGDIYVRVVGISSNNAVLLVSAKKVSAGGNILITVCNTSSFSVFSSVRFEIYAINSYLVGWTF